MWQDPLVTEIHKIREQIAQAHGNDIHAICEAARRGELSRPLPTPPTDMAQPVVAPDGLAAASLRQVRR
jgi:hypothetical protein